VGGWHNTHLMRVAVAVVYDCGSGEFTTYHEDEVQHMLERMFTSPAVIGFNSRRFDYGVLRAYTNRNLDELASFDLLEDIHTKVGHRLSLDHLGQHTLGRPKTADGLQSLAWWRDGEVEKVEAYCKADVALVRDLIEHATREGHVLFQKSHGPVVRLVVDWSLDAIVSHAASG
jgi:DEAD/DEAH box helicase domain-containing protein